MFVITDDSIEEGVRLITGSLNGVEFSLICENGIWREQTGNFNINDSEFIIFMNAVILA